MQGGGGVPLLCVCTILYSVFIVHVCMHAVALLCKEEVVFLSSVSGLLAVSLFTTVLTITEDGQLQLPLVFTEKYVTHNYDSPVLIIIMCDF